MEGGSANDYDYTSGDPVNSFDLDGLKKRQRPLPGGDLYSDCHAKGDYDRDVLYSDECSYYIMAKAKNDSSIYWDFHDRGITLAKRHKPRYNISISCPKWVKTLASAAGVGGAGRAYNQLGDDPGGAAKTLAKTGGIYAAEEGAYRIARLSRYSPYVTAGATAVDAVCTNF